MVRALFDTNILIDYLNGIEQAHVELARFTDRSISVVTWMEVMVGATSETEPAIRRFLASFANMAVDGPIGETAVALRQKHRIKLPDAIVWATAQVHGCILVTRNTKDFRADEAGVRIPYILQSHAASKSSSDTRKATGRALMPLRLRMPDAGLQNAARAVRHTGGSLCSRA